MTEDAANRQKAEKSGITSMSGLFLALPAFFVPVFMFFIVRKYVEGMKDSTQLLDLLAAVGSEDMEPTKAAAGRQALYPDVRFSLMSPIIYLFCLTLWINKKSTFPLRRF
jgi:exosome complex exonuclease DIS3/RRP44